MGQCCCNSCHSHTENLSHKDSKKTIFIHEYFLPSVSFLMLITGMIMNHFDVYWFEIKPIATLWYLSAFLLFGIPVLKEAAESIMKKDFFNEFSLMSLASI